MKYITLTHGFTAIIDDEDSDLAKYKWYANKSANGGFYARRGTYYQKKKGIMVLHRVIATRVWGERALSLYQVDHINGNTLDNRRSNLRLATHAQNNQNHGRPSSNTSGFMGVTFDKQLKRYRAKIKSNGKNYHLGYFDSPEDAHKAYLEAARLFFGDFARTESTRG